MLRSYLLCNGRVGYNPFGIAIEEWSGSRSPLHFVASIDGWPASLTTALHNMSTTAPGPYKEGFRHAEVTFDNQGAILQIAAWFLMVVMILATFLRLTIRFTTRQVPGLDDTILIVAMVSSRNFSVGEISVLKRKWKIVFGHWSSYCRLNRREHRTGQAFFSPEWSTNQQR